VEENVSNGHNLPEEADNTHEAETAEAETAEVPAAEDCQEPPKDTSAEKNKPEEPTTEAGN